MGLTVHYRFRDGRQKDTEFTPGVEYQIPAGVTSIIVVPVDPAPRPGPCPVSPDSIFVTSTYSWCMLETGHAGDHVTSDGLRWRETAPEAGS